MFRRSFKVILTDLRRPTTHAWVGEMLRFLVGGGVNVAVGYGSYLVLLLWFRYEVAYAIAYVAGIAVSYLFSALYVFRQPLRWRSALFYPLVYLLQFLLGLVLLKILIEAAHLPKRLAPLAVALLTIPATFLTSRVVIRTS